MLAAVLAMSSADAATVGASATELRAALHISNTDIGLLVTASSLVAAVASLPFGVLADRVKRTRTLGVTVILWGLAMLWSAMASNFAELLLARLALGLVTASAGPIVASMVGDYFPSAERGRVYSYILTGELAGAGIGFVVTGDVAALSWRAAFVLLALPTFVLARFLFRLPEPVRGGRAPLAHHVPGPDGPPGTGARQTSVQDATTVLRPSGSAGTGSAGTGAVREAYDPFPYPDPDVTGGVAPAAPVEASRRGRRFRARATPAPGGRAGPDPTTRLERDGPGDPTRSATGVIPPLAGPEVPHRDREVPTSDAAGLDAEVSETDAQRVARQKGILPDPDAVLRKDPRRIGIWEASRYLLRIRTNNILIVASAFGYFYLSGVETFASEFTHQQYGVPQALANVLILLIGVGAVAGVLVGGGVSDLLLRRRYLNARVLVAGIAALATTFAFLPAILTRSSVAALPYLILAGFALTAQNPPIDAARLDIVPPLLWGRAEGLRTLLRTAAQSLSPVLFGASTDLLGGGRSGLQWTFAIMLLPLLANGVVLLLALRTYPRDVATAAAGPA